MIEALGSYSFSVTILVAAGAVLASVAAGATMYPQAVFDVDEVLAVGDAEFQKKCLGKMQDVAGHGRAVLFVLSQEPSIHRSRLLRGKQPTHSTGRGNCRPGRRRFRSRCTLPPFGYN